ELADEAVDQRLLSLRCRGIGRTATDRALVRPDDPLAAKQAQCPVGCLLTEGAEGRPLAADEAENRRAARDLRDEVVARDAAGEPCLAARQRPNAGVAVDDLLWPHRNAGEDI